MPTIGDVEVVHPRHGLLQIVWPRRRATQNLVASLVCLLLGWAFILGIARCGVRDPSSGSGGVVVLLSYLTGFFFLVKLLLSILTCARIAIWGEALTFSREIGTIERNGKLLVRFDEVSHVEVRTTTRMKTGAYDTVSMIEVNQLSIILKRYKRVRIHDVWEGQEGKAEQIELAKELAQMLGVRVTFPQYVE